MAINLLRDRGIPLDRQRFTWKDLVQVPYSVLDDDAFTRVRVILMNGIESEALRFGHACARMNGALQAADTAYGRAPDERARAATDSVRSGILAGNPDAKGIATHATAAQTDGYPGR